MTTGTYELITCYIGNQERARRSNNCEHLLCRSLLRGAPGPERWRAGPVLALRPREGESIATLAERLLGEAGLASPLDLRERVPPLGGRWHCAPAQPDEVAAAVAEEPLRTALLLSLCGPAFYAPDRPIIWTEARLARRLRLFSPPTDTGLQLGPSAPRTLTEEQRAQFALISATHF